MTNYDILELDTWVTDRELALMNTLDHLFLESDHFLCTWHVNMNILANCRKDYPADVNSPLVMLRMLARPTMEGYEI
jgi:hypothetical protein